jgi:hypothetical protein
MKECWNRFYNINQKDGETEKALGEKWNECVKSEQIWFSVPQSEEEQNYYC